MTKVLDIIGANKLLNPIYKKYLWGNKHLTQIYFGGSSSGKSFAIAQRAVLDVLNGRNYLVVRKTGASIAKSSFNEIREKIYQFKVQSFFRINASAFTITCTLNNCQFIFTGLDDVEKVKSIRPLTGVITDIWIEEATEISVNDYRQLTKRLRGVSRFPKRITMSFNPILKTHWIYKEFFATLWRDDQQYVEDKTTSILKTTYKDNVHLMPDDIERLESETDPYYRDVYLLGNWGALSGMVFNNWRVEDFDKESFENYRFGIDWGFSCLCGESLVTTSRGLIKIKDIKIGDKVLTREGYKQVIHTQNNGYKEVYALDFGLKKSIIATADHRIFTASGWKRVDELQEQETICVKQSNLMASFINKLRGNGQQNIIDATKEVKPCIFIEKYGNFIMEKSQRAMSYIIKILTHLIIILKIWFVLPLKNTQSFIVRKNLLAKWSKVIEKKLNILKKIGKKDGLRQCKQLKSEGESAENVGNLLLLQMFIKNTVQRIVENMPILGKVWQNISVKCAASRLWLQRITKEQLVLKSVHIKRQLLTEKKEVYDITVENGEYFANDVLVHNCDPFAFVRVAIDIQRRKLYICDEIYQVELLNDKAIELIKPIVKGGIVWCDSAEPKSIAEFRANGINARPVKKGQGSVEEGINFIKRFEIIVHPFCVNTIKELSTYHYKVDRTTGETLPIPVDADNHSVDGIRYSLIADMGMRGTVKDVL